MEKDADAFRTISEVGEDLDLPQHVLRFWETRFTQIKPIKRGGGRRYYRPDDVDLLRGIKHLLYAEGFTIKGVQKILREESPRYVQAVGREGRVPPLGDMPGPIADSGIDVGFGELPDEADDGIVAPVAASATPPAASAGPVAHAPRRIEPAFGGLAGAPAQPPEPAAGRQEPDLSALSIQPGPAAVHEDGPALFAVDPASAPVSVRAVRPKPKQLALFEGMGDEGLSAKDRETLRQALERIDECRKILSSADLAKTPLNADI